MFVQTLALLALLLLVPATSLPVPVLSGLSKERPARAAAGELLDLDSPAYQALFDELADRHGFDRQELASLFAGVRRDQRVLDLMDRQWEAKPYYQYAALFITPANIAAGRARMAQYQDLLDRIEVEIGVDREIVLAIWAIESRFGARQGRYQVFRTLNTLFACYPRRSSFFRAQLIEFLLLCRENGVDVKSVHGSYAGAFGQTQFIPSSFRAYAVSFDGDEKRDVWNSVPDVLASIASYLKHFGWTLEGPRYFDIGPELKDPRLEAAWKKGRKGRVPWKVVCQAQGVDLPPSPGGGDLSIVGLETRDGGMRYVAGYPNFQAITYWNHSNRYAMAVCELAERFAAGEEGR